MKKRLMLSLICILLIFSTFAVTGCTKVEKQTEYPLKIYFVAKEYIETGNESEVLLEYDGASLYCDEGAKPEYQEALELLYEIPEDMKNAENAETVVTDRIDISEVYVKDNTAYVDIVGESLTGGGSLEESLFISQIVETLVNSFDEIKNVQFLIDGEVSESLMGHFDATEPYEKGLFE